MCVLVSNQLWITHRGRSFRGAHVCQSADVYLIFSLFGQHVENGFRFNVRLQWYHEMKNFSHYVMDEICVFKSKHKGVDLGRHHAARHASTFSDE